jgi:hypothetical protein
MVRPEVSVEENCVLPTHERPNKGSQHQAASPVNNQEEPNYPREEKRAGVYGLKLNDLLDQPIVVSPGKYVRLSGLGRQAEPGLARLQPKNLDDVKRWIGIPDALGAKRSCGCDLPAGVPGVSTAGDVRQLDPNMQRALHDLANQYVNGDSRPLAAYQSTLNLLVDRAVINGVFLRQDIDIHTGAVLEIAKDLKVLFAGHIRIWRGGLLKLKGPTKIDCVSITGNLTNMIVAVDHLPSFATLISLEAINA